MCLVLPMLTLSGALNNLSVSASDESQRKVGSGDVVPSSMLDIERFALLADVAVLTVRSET